MWRWAVLTGLLLVGVWRGVAPAAATYRTTEELRSFVLTPEELGDGFVTVFEESDTGQTSFFRVLERRSPSLAVLGVIALGDPVVTPREAVATVVRPFLLEYEPGEPYVPPGFPDGTIALPLSGGLSGMQTTGVALAWQEADVLAIMTVLVEWAPNSTVTSTATEVARSIELQRDKLAAALATGSGVPASTMAPASIASGPGAEAAPAQAPLHTPQQPRLP